MILHLRDVYWSREGRLSVDLASLTAACLGLSLVGFSPAGADPTPWLRTGTWLALALHAWVVITCALKGKYRLGLIGAFVPFVALSGSLRLARPGSLWFAKRYSEVRQQAARERAASVDATWGPWAQRWRDVVGGSLAAGWVSPAVVPEAAERQLVQPGPTGAW